ncbi:hypothetical protein [Fangia hongkongensis]|uniref:hypothetical protein n=1 Tax=Fangia hongkongensis TaxID=270495 RepID=UPI00037C114B|nr:hypothetical protein [Fangia hongkongensis]MBK2125861.1 hypothetical protein [Fangia hongkongensis]
MYSVLIDYSYDEYKILTRYANQVIQAVGILHGASHLEVILQSDLTPKLVEIGARVAGSTDLSAVSKCIGTNQVIELVKSYLDEKKFLKDIDKEVALEKFAMHVFLFSTIEGDIQAVPQSAPWCDITTLHSSFVNLTEGNKLEKTTSLANFSGYVYLLSDKQNTLHDDYTKFRKLENEYYQQLTKIIFLNWM